MTNNSIFTRVLALMICFVMLVGTLTACFNEVDGENHTGTTTNGEVTTKPTTTTTTTTTTGDVVEDEPTEDPVDPNVIFSASTNISSDSLIYGTLANDVVIGGTEVGALVPADVKVEAGASSLALSVKKVDEELLGDALSALDVHINGVALDNTVPMVVKLGAILETGLGATELKLYHTENGTPVLMTRVNDVTDFGIHNQYVYDAETGEVTIYVASFSLFTMIKSTADEWDGKSTDTSWYNDNDTEFTLTTVEQFVGFRDLVDAGNTFEGKTVKLGVDIDLKNIAFDPIGFGYYKDEKRVEENDVLVSDTNTVFLGTFDGGNHTIYNLYENCWELDPDKTNYGTYTYSTAGAGLFASVKDATIKNIAINGAEVVFECVDMGVLVGYAQGECHFENIVISNAKIANYNRYTGGLVGEVSYGVDNNGDGYSHTFKNITIDSTVTVSGLWGSFGCGMGGVIGGKWGTATVLMENVVSAPVMDVYNDVVSAYQWYAFRGCGMLIGHTEEPYSDGRTSGNATATFLTCKNVNVYYGDWVDYTYYQFAEQTDAEGNILWYSNYPWVRAEEGKYCEAFSNIRYGIPLINGVKVTELSEEEFKAAVTDSTKITFDQLYGADRGMYGTNEHPGVNVSYKSPKTFYIKNNVGWENLTLHYTYEIGEETWTTIPDGVELFESNGVYRVDLPVGAVSFTITADGGYTSKEFIVSELTEKDTLLLGTVTCEHEYENACDTTCNKCEETREVGEHAYDNACDADCNECGAERTPAEHVYDDACDTTCNVCGATREITHTAGEAVVENKVESSCTVAGSQDNVVYCSVCETELSRETVTVDATGHTHINGVCSCGDDIRKTITIEFSQHNIANETDANGLKFEDFTINASKGTHQNSTPKYYTSDASIRVYVGNTLTVTSEGFVILNITFTTVSDSYNLKNAKFTSGTPTTTETTTILTGVYSDSLTLTNANSGKTQMRIVKMEITYYVGESCKHDVGTKEVTVEPSCTEVGYTATVCSNCDMVIDKTNEVSARGHDYDEGNITTEASCTTTGEKTYTCQVCGDEKVETVDPLSHTTDNGVCGNCGEQIGGTVEPETPISNRYYIATKRTTGNYWFMTSDLGSASTKRYTAIDTGLTTLPEEITNGEIGKIFVLEENDDGTYSIYAEGVKGDNYLGWTSGNSGKLVSESNALKLTIDKKDDGTYNIHFTASDGERYLALNETSNYNYFAWYKSGQKQDLILIPVVGGDNGGNEGGDTPACQHTNATSEVTQEATCVATGVRTYRCECGETWPEEIAIDSENHVKTTGTCDCGVDLGGSTEPTQQTVTMNIYANKGKTGTNTISWTSGDVTVTNNKAGSSTAIRTSDSDHYRIYKSSQIVISVSDGNITQVVITCTSSSYANGILNGAKDAGFSATLSGSVVTITVNNAESIIFTASEQARMNKVEVTYTK